MGLAVPYHVMDGYSFVAYPNRDSVPFREFYQIPEADTVVRGSLRYEGNPAMIRALISLGWLDTESKDWLMDGMTWAQIQQRAIEAQSSAESDLIVGIDRRCAWTSTDEREQVLSGLRWIGLFSDDVPIIKGNLLDTLSAQLEKLCSFQPGERDLVMLQHKFVVEWKDGTKVDRPTSFSFFPAQLSARLTDVLNFEQDTITSTLELFGDPDGYSAMSKSVGVTCGIASQLMLDGFGPLNEPGVLAPYTREICDAIRVRLEAEGIKLVERTL